MIACRRRGQSFWLHAGSQPERDHDEEGVEFTHECLIFEVCQPQQAKKVLDQNMSVSTALPLPDLHLRGER
jgi:hypothetical protein